MTKRRLRGLIENHIPSHKTEREKNLIIGEIMKRIGKSFLHSKVSQTNDKGILGVFYDAKDTRIFEEQINEYLEQELIPKEESLKLTPPGKLEKELESKTKTSNDKESSSPPPNQLSINQACKYLKEKYDIEISSEDLEKIAQGMLLTRKSLKDAYKFKMFEVIPTEVVEHKFHKYEVEINSSKGIPRYFCEYSIVLFELFNED